MRRRSIHLAVLGIALSSTVSLAAGKQPAAKPNSTKSSAPKPSLVAPGESSESLISKVRSFYESLDYDKVLIVAEVALGRTDLSLPERLELYRYFGSAKAIVEDPVDAEKPFRMRLRYDPNYDQPATTPPMILAVFRKVQSEERALAEQLHEVERSRVVAGLKLVGELPSAVKGGRPVVFNFQLKDPTRAVESIRVPFRRAGVTAYSSLALQRNEEGDWRGVIPGDVTADPAGFEMEYYVETAGVNGPLLSVGASDAPRRIQVSKGAVTRPPPLNRWAFFTAAGVTAASGLTAGAFGVAFRVNQNDYRALAMREGRIDGGQLVVMEQVGNRFALGTNIALIATGVSLISSVVIAFLVNWANEP